MCTRIVCSATAACCRWSPVVFVGGAAGPAAAASPSELLQKAIYTEETVGNLDEAMKLYEQVIAEGKAGAGGGGAGSISAGALLSQRRAARPTRRRPSRRSSRTIPNAKDLVAQARKHLPSELKLLPAPWVVGERLQLNMKLPTGLDIGTMIYMVDAAKHDGKDVTRCSTRGLVTDQRRIELQRGALRNGEFPADHEPLEALAARRGERRLQRYVGRNQRRSGKAIRSRSTSRRPRSTTNRASSCFADCRSRWATRRRSP